MIPTFLNSGLLLGGAIFALVALPVLIHLINLVRRRRIEWAAMEFLLASQKKNSRWILLKQWLLLLLRVLAVAAVILMLAQPLVQNRVGRWFGALVTHHIVLVDDTYSQSDRWANTSGIGEAKRAIERLTRQMTASSQRQTFTLLRASETQHANGRPLPDLYRVPVDDRFSERITAALEQLEPSEMDVAPAQSLEALSKLLADQTDENRVIYLLSDFRTKDWDDPRPAREWLDRFADDGAKLHLVRTIDEARPNLAVSGLTALPGIRAAGVPLAMEVTVTNFSPNPARQVSVLLQEDGKARPALVIDEIAAEGSERRRFPVFFGTAGEHVVTAALEADGVDADNHRHAVIDFPLTLEVLLVDGDPAAKDARFLATAFAPGGGVKTGIDARIETTTYLNREPLARFRAIYLTNLERLDDAAINALEQYVRDGGALIYFTGARTVPSFVNDSLYKNGEGWFPAPVGDATALPVNRLDKAADLEFVDHPMFRVFAGERNTFISAVNVEKYTAVAPGWEPAKDGPTQVIARLRNGAPLVIERRFGAGRVTAVLTTASTDWNNWARNPSYVVAMLEMQAHLTAEAKPQDARLVGQGIDLNLDGATYGTRHRMIAPARAGQIIETFDARTRGDRLELTIPETRRSGIYEIELAETSGATNMRRFAVNVAPGEGDLRALDRQDLATRLPELEYDFSQAGDIEQRTESLAGIPLASSFLYGLIVLLLAEQALAYAVSYHAPQRGAAR
ncbi:MAG: BatA domain-containing protein [Planctomycetia bacterium]|nr:BatA domain-containing protein [Planctomycetia bacterium]